MAQGKFYQKVKDAVCHLNLLESLTSWCNAAEIEITGLKSGVSHELQQSRALKL